jgi:hypothetical protein
MQQEMAGRLISFWPLLLGVVSFFFLFFSTFWLGLCKFDLLGWLLFPSVSVDSTNPLVAITSCTRLFQ